MTAKEKTEFAVILESGFQVPRGLGRCYDELHHGIVLEINFDLQFPT